MLKLAPIFANEMIMQAEKPVRVWGTADGKVTVSCGSDAASTLAENEKWLVELPSHYYGDVCDINVTCGEEQITLSSVTFGDVYLLAGQSNMQFKLHEAIADGEICENSDIRLFSTDRLEDNEYFKSSDGWVKCNKNTAPNFSAIGYFVARDLYKKKKRPIGLVSLYQGASVIQSWLSPSALEELNVDIPADKLHWDHHNEAFSRWNKNSVLYNFGFSQVVPFSFAAVLWYQGESNASECESKIYDKLLQKMILTWREDLLNKELPFVIIQIADCDARRGDEWTRVQEAQQKVAIWTPNCHFVKCADICETNDIHPPTKHILANRIANVL